MTALRLFGYAVGSIFVAGALFGIFCTAAAWWVAERVRAGRGSGPSVTPVSGHAAASHGDVSGTGSIDPHVAALAHHVGALRVAVMDLSTGLYLDSAGKWRH